METTTPMAAGTPLAWNYPRGGEPILIHGVTVRGATQMWAAGTQIGLIMGLAEEVELALVEVGTEVTQLEIA